MTPRRVPETGEPPLREILAALPRDLVVGIEVPRLHEAAAGVGSHERLRPGVEAARELLASPE